MTSPEGRTPVTWEELLAAMEADVEQVAAAVREGEDVPLPDWTPPGDPGPLPEHLEARARRLSRRIDEVQAFARDRADGLGAELDDLTRRRTAGAAYQRG